MWTLIVFFAFGGWATIASVGEPRKPLTPGIAATTVITLALVIAGIHYLGTT